MQGEPEQHQILNRSFAIDPCDLIAQGTPIRCGQDARIELRSGLSSSTCAANSRSVRLRSYGPVREYQSSRARAMS
jgi:hypothetical protein